MTKRAGSLARVLICAGAALALVACGTDGVTPTRYQMESTQPSAIANPAPSPPAASAKADAPSGPFEGWAAVVVSGSETAPGGKHTEAFDNARRDLSEALYHAGFGAHHILQYSADPGANDPTDPYLATVDGVKAGLNRLLATAGKGCLIYVTGHGNTSGVQFGDKLASPSDLRGLANKTCGLRPTVMIISACHSGVFVPALEAANRMVMTAARADRASFGCGTNNKYPYFDQCVIESLPHAADFPKLADDVKACVSRMETAEHFVHSEPQLAIGDGIAPLLTADRFETSTRAQVTASCSTSSASSCSPGSPAATMHPPE
jgi:hypothetical protein